jgi:hypothetical protein
MSRITRRVLAGCVAAAVLVAGGVVLAQRATRAPPDLPEVSPAALIASTLTSLAQGEPQSGSVSATLDLGVPDLIDLSGQAGPLSLLTGTHTLKVWRSSDGLRISALEPAGEEALFISRGHAWAWDFDSLTAYDLGELPPIAAFLFGALGGGGPGIEAILRRELASVGNTTRVGVEGTASVAGRPTYRLVIAPKQHGTLVGAIELDIDSKARLPLSFTVVPRGSRHPAISLEFTSVTFDRIDPSTFAFTPPPGVSVRRVGSGVAGGALFDRVRGVRTFGRGWTAVFAVELPPIGQGGLGGILGGGPFLQFGGPLFSVRVANRGDHSWVLIGAIPMDRLRALEGSLP